MEATASKRREASGDPAPELPAQNVPKAFYEQVDRLGAEGVVAELHRQGHNKQAARQCGSSPVGEPRDNRYSGGASIFRCPKGR